MNKISAFVYCENTHQEMTTTGPKMHISNPFSSLLPSFVPGNFSFNICIGLAGVEESDNHTLRVTFGRSDDSPRLVDTGAISFGVQADSTISATVPIEYQGTVIGMEFKNVLFRAVGEYVSHVYVDEVLEGSYPIMVHGREGLE
ncbi:hypothetical protein LWE69_19940 [Paenibacillus sp. UKAQ_18]|nr:hypothetical protein [Paenibacillus sp. UKAQ_18]